MFCVNVTKTKTLLIELQNQLRILNHVLCEIEEVSAKYSREHEVNECSQQIKMALEELGEERASYLTLVSLLRDIVEQYEETEENILESFDVHMRRDITEPAWLAVEYCDEARDFIDRVIIWKGATNGECN